MIKELGIRVHGIQCRQAIVMIELPKRSQTCITILVGRTKQAPAYKARSPCWKRNFKFFSALLGQKKSLFLKFLQIYDINKITVLSVEMHVQSANQDTKGIGRKIKYKTVSFSTTESQPSLIACKASVQPGCSLSLGEGDVLRNSFTVLVPIPIPPPKTNVFFQLQNPQA